jgi:mRNA-degrading endonuclease toxin of MazEF toxin-antitoxin module
MGVDENGGRHEEIKIYRTRKNGARSIFCWCRLQPAANRKVDSVKTPALTGSGGLKWSNFRFKSQKLNSLLGKKEGLPQACVVNLDNVHSVAVERLRTKIGALSVQRAEEVERALGFAWDIPRLKSDS